MGVAKSALEGLVRYLALELGEQRVRVNAISPGAIPTLSGMGEVIAFIRDREALARQRGDLYRSAIGKLDLDASSYPDEVDLAKTMWQHTQDSFMSRCLIKDSVTKEDVAACALFLGSRYSRKITGQVIHVDCGLSSALVL
jgi:enoyl-[acyl-carrier protein] reductase I